MTKILIIEDEVDISRILRKQLMDRKFSIICASDAMQGIQLAHKELPDLIILDLMLPAGGGFTVLKNIRISTSTLYIPVIVLTGMQDEEYKKKILALGVDAYLGKPYEIDVLVESINKTLHLNQ
jgi:chemosensory pili system protein ChpA (sensor histidine kinase/response regulator)